MCFLQGSHYIFNNYVAQHWSEDIRVGPVTLLGAAPCRGREVSLFSATFRKAVGTVQLSIQSAPEVLSQQYSDQCVRLTTHLPTLCILPYTPS